MAPGFRFEPHRLLFRSGESSSQKSEVGQQEEQTFLGKLEHLHDRLRLRKRQFLTLWSQECRICFTRPRYRHDDTAIPRYRAVPRT